MIRTIRQIRGDWWKLHWLEKVGFLTWPIVSILDLVVILPLDLIYDLPAKWIWIGNGVAAVVMLVGIIGGQRLRHRRANRWMQDQMDDGFRPRRIGEVLHADIEVRQYPDAPVMVRRPDDAG